MIKKLSKNKIRFISLFLTFFSIFILLNVNFVNTVSASQTLICNFDDVSAGLSNFTSGLFEVTNLGKSDFFKTSTDYDLSPYNSLLVGGTQNVFIGGWANLTTSFNYVGRINFSFNLLDCMLNHLYMSFYNGTTRAIYLDFGHDGLMWYDDMGWETIYTGTSWTNYMRYYLVIEHKGLNNFNVTLYNATFVIKGQEDVASYTSDEWTSFSGIYWNLNTYCPIVYFDDFYIDTGTFFTPPTGDTEGCQDYDSSYTTISTGYSYTNEYSWSFATIEFQTAVPIEGTINGLELYIQADVTSSLSNYHVYINGAYGGTADCCYGYLSGYKLQFNNIEIDHSLSRILVNIYNPDEYLALLVDGSIKAEYYPHMQIRYGNTEHINNIFDGLGETRVTPQYTIYYNHNETIESSCGLSNNIAFVNILDDENIKTFKTVFMSVTVNETISPYHKLVIYKNGVSQTTQNYPMDITKCSGIYGFTPVTTGTYSVALTNNSVNITGTIHYFNVTEDTEKKYNMYTTPNPSLFGGEIILTTFINDTGDFAVGFYLDPESTLDLTDSLYTVYLDEGWSNTTVSTGQLINDPTYCLRMFKDVTGLWSPVGEIYIHYFEVAQQQSNIQLSDNDIFVGDSVIISGHNYKLMGHVAIFSNNVILFNYIPNGYFNYNKTFDSSGVYRISLKEYQNDLWIELDFRILTVNSQAGDGDDFFGIPNLRGSSMGYLVGLIIVFIFVILPMRIQKGLHIKQSLPSFVYIFTGLMGIVTSTVLPFFDVWILAFIIIMSLIYLVAKYLVGSGTSSEE